MEPKFFERKEKNLGEKSMEKKSDTEKIIDMMAEMYAKGGKTETLAEKETAGKILETGKFIEILSEIVKKKREKGEKPHVILATYYRVGKRALPREAIVKPDLTLDILNGSPNLRPSEKEIKEFFKKTAANLERQLMYMESGPIVVFYGGSGENFNEAGQTIDHLSSLTEILDEEKKPKFFLLTCRCALEEKIKAAMPLIQAERLEGLVYGKEKNCGGFNDLEEIAESLISKGNKEPLN